MEIAILVQLRDKAQVGLTLSELVEELKLDRKEIDAKLCELIAKQQVFISNVRGGEPIFRVWEHPQ